MAKLKAWKATLSGAYFNSKNEYVDFQDVEVFLPKCSEAQATAACIKRYAPMAIALSNTYKERSMGMREVYVDSLEETEAEFSFIDKDIMEMTFEELQDLAVAKGLRSAPLYKAESLRGCRDRTYVAYAKSLGMGDKAIEAKRKLVVSDSTIEPMKVETKTAEEMNADAMKGLSIKPAADAGTLAAEEFSMTREEMEQLANDNGIKFHPNLSDEKLYERIFA